MKEIGLILLGLILGIPFSYFADFTFPWIKSYWDKRYLSFRERRLYILTIQYIANRSMKKYPELFTWSAFRDLALGFMLMMPLMLYLTVIILFRISSFETRLGSVYDMRWIDIIVMTLLTLGCIQPFISLRNNIQILFDFEKYKKKTQEKMKRLGVKAEFFDEIDNLKGEEYANFVYSMIEKKRVKLVGNPEDLDKEESA